LLWQAIALEQWDKVLAKATPTAVEIAFVRNLDACEGCSLVGEERPIKGFEPGVDVSPPELSKDLTHCNRPYGCAKGIGNMTQFLSIRR
jgi:hypothetical protein